MVTRFVQGTANMFGKGDEMREAIASERGSLNVGSLFGLLIMIVLATAVIPLAITSVVDVDTSTWGAGPILLWGVVALIIVAGFVFMLGKHMGLFGGKN